MPAPTKTRRSEHTQRDLRSGRYDYTSSNAYQLQREFDTRTGTDGYTIRRSDGRSLSREMEKGKAQPLQKPKAKAKSIRRWKLSQFLKVAGVFVMCATLLYRYAIILESDAEITNLEKEYAAIESKNSAIRAQVDQALDLVQLEQVAKEELGMVKPESSQIFYVDMHLGDQAEIAKKGEEEPDLIKSAPGTLIHAFQMLK